MAPGPTHETDSRQPPMDPLDPDAPAPEPVRTAGPASPPSGPVVGGEAPVRDGRAGRAGGDGAGPEPSKDDRGLLGFFRELPVLLIIAFILALLIKTFLIQAFFIPSESMLPTLEVGDRVLVNKVVYRLHPPRRGDVIVFEEPATAPEPDRNPLSAFWRWLTEGLGLSTNPDKDFIKRVVGLPGETIEINRCVVYIDGQPLREPYVSSIRGSNCEFAPHRVAQDSLFVMGDNRGNSRDSRFGLGDIPFDKVVGRAFVIIWPPSRVGWVPGG